MRLVDLGLADIIVLVQAAGSRFMTINVTKQGDGFIASVAPLEAGGAFIQIRAPLSPLTLMQYLCSKGYPQHDVAVAILEADPEAFEGISGLDWGLE